MLQLAFKPWTDWFEDNFVAAAMIMTAVVALAGVGSFGALRRRDPSSTFLVAALIILAPFEIVVVMVFSLIVLLLVVIAIMSAALDPSMGAMVERNFGLTMGVALITMAAVVSRIYVVRREPNTIGERLSPLWGIRHGPSWSVLG